MIEYVTPTEEYYYLEVDSDEGPWYEQEGMYTQVEDEE